MLSRLSDFLNPILVKEVRQGLRGRYFKGTYALTLFIATVVGLFVLVAGQDQSDVGQAFFTAIYVCLTGAVMALVPFQAYVSTATADPRQADILALSNLRPRQIVWGRLLATLVQGGLIVSALFPFLGLAYLLPGVDLGAAIIAVATVLIFGSVMACLTIAASWLTSNKLLRVLIMAMSGLFQMFMAFTAAGMGFELVNNPNALQNDEFYWAVAFFWGHGLMIGGFALVGAAARIGHKEENRSTLARLLTTALVLLGTAAPFLILLFSTERDDEIQLATTAYTLFLACFPVSLFVTEPERYGRRVQLQVPRNRLLALLITPWLPGGANGVMLAVILGLIAIVPVVVLQPFAVDFGHHLWPVMAAGFCYWVLLLCVPSWPLSRWTTKLPVRVLSFFAIPTFSFLALTVPIFVGFLIDQRDWEDGHHSLNPFWAAEELWRGRGEAGEVIAVVVAMTMLALLINIPRMYRALSRTLDAAERPAARPRTADERPVAPSDEVAPPTAAGHPEE